MLVSGVTNCISRPSITSNTSAESCLHELTALWQHARACKDLKLQHQAQYDPCLRWVQASSVRQHLYELHIMDFLIRAISLEAELQLSTAVPLSSTATSADLPQSAGHCAAPSALAAKASPLSPMTQTDAALVRLDSASQKPTFSKLSSRLRLPSLPSDSIRSPKISAGYPDKGPGLGSARQLGFEMDDHKMPPGFVSSGDLQEDMHLLAALESEVCMARFLILLCMCGML